jgi:beta-glucosidase
VTGIGWQRGACVGNTSPAPSIALPSLCFQDGPVGVRYVGGGAVTVFPAGVHAAATWDAALIKARGLGVHVLLAPVAGPLGKVVRGGRNWEGFSPDPYLTWIAMAESIKGLQEAGVQASA